MAPRLLTIDDYEITIDGKIINKETGHTLKPQPNGKGYLRVSISKKLVFVHRLVAEKYVPNPNNLPQVNHKDGNKLNNHANNLEWVSNQENRTHAVVSGLHLSGEAIKTAKMDWEKVEHIRANPHISNQYYAELYGVSVSTIRDIKSYRTWKLKNSLNSKKTSENIC